MEAKKNQRVNLDSKKGIFFEVGLIVSLALVIAAFGWSSEPRRPVLTDIVASVDPDLVDNLVVNIDPPPPPPPPMPVPTDALVIVDNSFAVLSGTRFTSESNNTPVIEVPYIAPPKRIDIDPELEIIDVSVVQEKPLIDGADVSTFSSWVQQHVVYPPVAIENGLEGKVFIQFRIGKDGSVSNLKVLRGVAPVLDEEAARVIQSSSMKWTPAKQNGKPVSVLFTMPVTFRLQ